MLQLALDLVDRVGVEHFAQLGLPEELTQQHGVECECLRSSLGEWGVAFVDECRDVAEEK